MHPPRGRIRLQGLQAWEQGLQQIPRAFPWPLKLPSSVQSWGENSDNKILCNGPGMLCFPQRAIESQYKMILADRDSRLPDNLKTSFVSSQPSLRHTNFPLPVLLQTNINVKNLAKSTEKHRSAVNSHFLSATPDSVSYIHVRTQLLKQNLSLEIFTITLDFTQHELSHRGEHSHGTALSIYEVFAVAEPLTHIRGFISSVQLQNIPLTQLISNLAHYCVT